MTEWPSCLVFNYVAKCCNLITHQTTGSESSSEKRIEGFFSSKISLSGYFFLSSIL